MNQGKPDSKRIAWGSLGIIAVAVIAYFGVWFWPHWKLQGVIFFDWAQTTETREIPFQIASHSFSIPQNYFYSRSLPRGSVRGVSLEAILPELKPYTKETRAEFEKPGWNNTVDIALFTRNQHRTVADAFQANTAVADAFQANTPVFNFNETTDGISVPPLRHYVDPDPQGREIYALLKDGVAVFYLMCSKPGSVTSPSCDSFFDYAEDMYVEYSFGREYLNDWETIDRQVRRFVETHEVKK